MKRIKFKNIILFGTFIVILMTFVGCKQVENKPLEVPKYVQKEHSYNTETIIKQKIYDSNIMYARVSPIKDEIYKFEYPSGYVKEILVKRDDMVKKGDLLVTIENDDLFKKIRNKEIDYKIEQLKVEKLKNIYKTTGKGKYELDMEILNLKIVKYSYDKLIKEKELLNIYATIDGKIDSISVIVNKFIKKGTDIIEVVDNSDTYISFSDKDTPGLVVGSKVDLYISTHESVKATVIEINKKEKIVIIKPDSQVEKFQKIGSLFKVEIIIDEINNAIAVKKAWIHEVGGTKFVYVLENATMTEREVSTGKILGGWVEILLGLEEGDKVITNFK